MFTLFFELYLHGRSEGLLRMVNLTISELEFCCLYRFYLMLERDLCRAIALDLCALISVGVR